jgi:hypothetical protein
MADTAIYLSETGRRKATFLRDRRNSLRPIETKAGTANAELLQSSAIAARSRVATLPATIFEVAVFPMRAGRQLSVAEWIDAQDAGINPI